MSATQIIEKITSTLEANVQNGQLVLTDTIVDSVPLGKLLDLLDTGASSLGISHVSITKADNTVTVAGKSSLLGADNIDLETIFTDNNGSISFSLSAKNLPACSIPGCPWLALKQAQIALQITGDTHDVTGTINGIIHAGNVDIAAVFSVAKTADIVVLNWTIAEINLSQIATVFLGSVSLPNELPIFSFKDVKTTVTPKTGAFSFEVISADTWDFPANGGGLSITEVKLDLERESSDTKTHCAIAISSSTVNDIVEGLAIEDFQLDFDFQGQEWSVTGNVDAMIADAKTSLTAAYTQKAAEKTLTLTAHSEMKPLDLGDIGSLSLSTLELEFTKPASSETNQPAKLEWSVSAEGAISIPGAIECAGKLSIYRHEKTAGLEFLPTQAKFTIPLPPDQKASLELDFDSLSLIRTTTDINTQEWLLDAKVDLTFVGLNATVQKYLPQTIPMQFKADKNSVALAVDGAIETIQFVIPTVDIPSLGGLVLGTAEIDISTLDISLGKNIELSAVLGVGLPSKLNNLFGVKKDQNGELIPTVEIFRTFDPQDPENSTVKLQLGITAAGIKVTPKTSFIKAIALVNENGKTRWHGDFGQYGAISVNVPEFTYSATSSAFAASGGFSMDKNRPLALPLSPIKHLLDACKLSGAAKMLPDALPFTNVKIDANNLVDKLVEMLGSLLQKIGSGQISDEARKVLDTIAQNFHKLPASFIEYLDIQIPQGFNFEIAVTPEGAVRLDASVEGDTPIKLLFPGIMGAMPVLNGITLRSISFGEIAGGSLFLLKMDADIDQFDLATLAAALAIPDNSVLPNTQNLQRRLKLNELYMVLPPELPIPIPLFYKNLGVEYLGLEGLTLQAHAQFPLPKPSLKALGELLSNFKQFFTDSNYRLDPQKPPQGLNPEFFSLHQNSLQLPKYLGGKMLAPQKDPTIDYAAIASLLNGIKFLTINDLIQAIPLSDRIGDVEAAFGPISANFGWLVTTPDEFKQLPSNPSLQKIAYQKLGLSSNAQANDILTVLPPAQTGGHIDEQGLIAFLKIGWKVANVTTFDAAFGLAASGSMGFNTGFRLTGSIASFVDVKLAGAIAIKGKPGASQTPSAIPDFTALTFNGQNQYVKLGNPAALNFSGQITIAAWIKPTAADGIRNIVAHGYNPTPAGEVYLRILDGQYQVGSWDGSSYFAAATMPTSDLGSWVHLAGVYDGTVWKLYRNGVLLATQVILIDRPAVPHNDFSRPTVPHTDTTNLFGQPTRNPFVKPTVHIDIPTQPGMHMDVPGQQAVQIALPNKGAFPVQSEWAIGARGTGTERFFQGQIAQVHIWNRTRSQAEIQAEMSQKLNSNEPGLVGNWVLDEGTGNVVSDRTINAITGTIQGAQWSQPAIPTNDAFRLNGSSLLTIPVLNNHQLFKGDIQVTDQAFACKGTLALFPSNSPLQVGGAIEGSLTQNSFFLSGKVATTLAGFVLTEATATISNHQIFVKGTWLGFSAALDVQMANNALQMRGQIGFNSGINANIGPLTEPSTGLVIVQSIPLNVGLKGNLDTTISYVGNIASFSGGVSGGFIWNNTSLNLPSGLTFHSAPVSGDDLKNQLVVYIQSHASELFNSFFNTPYKAFKAGFDGVVTLANNLQPALNAARSWSVTGWNSVSGWSTQAWKSSYQWRATAWTATTKWSDTAWQSTTKWSDTAWQSTTKWSDDAWNATTHWSDAAWKATTAWSDAAWNSTASWSKETWLASTTWTSKVWNSTKNWTVTQFQNPLQTLKDLFHIDSTIPRVNVEFPPHGDSIKIPHADSSGRHSDTNIGVIHIDSTPHFDTPKIHIDTPGVHTDTPAFHTDTPGL
jgi:hypothetical protein